MEQETISMIKSCIVSRKGGVPLVELNGEYEELVGEPIPYKRLGFQSLGGFISSVSQIKATRNEDGKTVLTLEDEKVAHITALVNKQKEAQRKRRKISPRISKIKTRDFNARGRMQRYPSRYLEKESFYGAPKKKSTKSFYTSNGWNEERTAHQYNSYNNYSSRRAPFYHSRVDEYPSRMVNSFTRNSYYGSRTYTYPSRNGNNLQQDRFFEEDTEDSEDEDDDSDSYDRPRHRLASVVGNVLKVTVQNTQVPESSDSYSASLSLSEELAYREFLASRRGSRIEENFQSLIEPMLFNHQMIGDDFFLNLANKAVETSQHRRNSSYSLGLCISGQRIRDCYRRILQRSVIAEYLVINLGAVDVVEGVDLSDMKSDMLDLLDILMPQVKSVVILTIPPLVNLCHIQRKWSTLLSFNRWLTQLDTGEWCRVVDIWPLFRGRRIKMYDYYEDFPRKIADSTAYLVLWNSAGRKSIIEYLRRKLLY
ncbi:maternal effect protein oskar-like [Periplaneta americana]|uniref:maternal effect protein oskar-like n=1 Tax=Periplaneta americana TaxID=6978 RepID=UPI0037E94719